MKDKFKDTLSKTQDFASKQADTLKTVFDSKKKRERRRRDKEFLKHTRNQRNMKGRGEVKKINTKKRVGPEPEWYKHIAFIGVPVAFVFLGILAQWFAMTMNNMFKPDELKTGFFHGYKLFAMYILIGIPVTGILIPIVYHKTRAVWYLRNALYLDEDIEEYHNDSYLRTVDHLTTQFDVAPDLALGFDGHASTLLSHIMVSNKGIRKIKIPMYDGDVDGFIKRDSDGNIVYHEQPMFDEKLAHKLFSMSGVPDDLRLFYDARDYDFNPIVSKKDGKRLVDYDRKSYDTLADAINNDFYELDTETARPAGVYFYDKRPVNTILIAITRGGKGNFMTIFNGYLAQFVG